MLFRALLISLFTITLSAKGQDTLSICKGLVEQGKFHEASIIIDAFCEHHDDTNAFLLCADTWYTLEMYDQAAKRYTSLVYLTKQPYEHIRKRALCLSLSEQYKPAEKEWQRVCTIQPNDKYNWYLLAQACKNLSEDERAIQALTKAIVIDSVFSDALTARSKLYLRQRNYQLALQDIDTCLKLLQYQETLFHDRGLALIGLKRYREAERMFNTIIKHEEKNAHAWFGLGSVYHAERNYEKALDAFDITISLKPDFEIAYFKRGLVKLELNNQTGCDDLLKAHQLGFPDALFYLKKYCNRD